MEVVMRASVFALLGFGALAVTCGDCDVRVISGAFAQAQNSVNEAGAPSKTDAEPGYWTNLFTNTMRYTVMHPGGKQSIDLFYNRDKSITSNAGLTGAWFTKGNAGKEEFCYTVGDFKSEPKQIGHCFQLRLMNNPRIGARWGGKFDQKGVNYLAEVVAGRETAPK
jgi:hypothetical protein